MTPPLIKQEIRAAIRARWNGLSAADRTAGADSICRRLSEQDFWRRAQSVLLFAPLPDEVDIWPLLGEALSKGKTAALPRFDPLAECFKIATVTDRDKDLVAGKFGVREPANHCAEIPAGEIELALVPGIGFDLDCRRLGRGKGFYDRLLEGFTGLKCGVALDQQLEVELPEEFHDIRMNLVITPTRLIGEKSI